MDFFTAVTKLETVKKYEKKDVDDKLIGVILYMANHAESAGGIQGWEFIVVRDPEVKNLLYKAAFKLDVVKDAPVDIVVCADLKKFSIKYEERGEYLYSIQDTAAAITIMMITAQFLGLGTNWIRAFDEQDVKTALGLPNELRPVGIVTLGYPAEKAAKPKPKEFEYMTSVDQFKKKYDISYLFQTGTKEEAFKPIINQIIDKLKKK
ncbi:MAG: nitroreductase family protein [Candidatus Aenigmatarchaeota archaeon]|nr:nitroreductase family protein [Candidatus Aenigmarchaeota archaeon]